MAVRPAAGKPKTPEDICREYGLPLTVQRRVVLEELAGRKDHPTADDVFNAVRRTLPEISRTTVYRVLQTFARNGIARTVCHPGAAARYEMRTRRHHHLVCTKCESIVDLDDPALDRLPFPRSADGFNIEDYSIQFRGVCSNCAGKHSAVRRVKTPSNVSRGGRQSH